MAPLAPDNVPNLGQQRGNADGAPWDRGRMDSTYAPRQTQQNVRGEWVPAIPEALRLLVWHQCRCGERFVGRRRYRAHYALAHILALDV